MPSCSRKRTFRLRPIADVRRLCKFPRMLKLVALCFSVTLATLPAQAISQEAPNKKTGTRTVRGLLDFGEYPNFLPDDLPGYTGLPFQIREQKWREVISKRDEYAMKYKPDYTECYWIIGKGHIAPRTPSNMWPAEEQFVFVKVKRLKKLKSNARCEGRYATNVR